MNSKNSSNNFSKSLYYFGILISNGEEIDPKAYQDIEKFILDASTYARTSRELEGVLCWLKKYGHILSPSKLRKLIKEKCFYEPVVLGALLDFAQIHAEQKCNFNLLKPYLKKYKEPISLISGPRVRNPDSIFLKRGLLIPHFILDEGKFLLSQKPLLKQNPEMKFRLLFGHNVNADVAAALVKDQSLNAYRTYLLTGNHKARVFAVFHDVKVALPF